MEATSLAAALIGGLVLGAVYFLALWGTVRRLSRARHPTLLLAGTGVLRITLLAGGIVMVGGGQWDGMLAAVGGFLFVRLAATRWARTPSGLNTSRR